MLLFRSEEHLGKWLGRHGLSHGATLTTEQQWQLARVWYADRADPEWIRRTPEAAEAVFASLGLTGDFWRLTPPGN